MFRRTKKRFKEQPSKPWPIVQRDLFEEQPPNPVPEPMAKDMSRVYNQFKGVVREIKSIGLPKHRLIEYINDAYDADSDNTEQVQQRQGDD